MTIAELIEHLKTLDQTAHVYVLTTQTFLPYGEHYEYKDTGWFPLSEDNFSQCVVVEAGHCFIGD
jgi:hypothetical protein